MLTLEDYAILEDAWKFQDFVTKEMLKMGISINAYQSRDYQMKYGESASGIEIKNDKRMSETGNVYIEFKQRTLRGTENKDSGINQKDDSWLYIIGDCKKFYIFAKNRLKRLLRYVLDNPVPYSKVGIRITNHKDSNGNVTSYGMVLPTAYIEDKEIMIRKYEAI